MRLHITPECITVKFPEHSEHFLHVSTTLAQEFSQSFWINETLINLPHKHEMSERKAFLLSLYYTCAHNAQTHNAEFLKKLIALHDKPIKVVKKRSAPARTFAQDRTEDQDYRLLGASPFESLQNIRKKYLHLAKRYHPDTCNSSNKHPLYGAKFQQIHEAYERIKAKRKEAMAA